MAGAAADPARVLAYSSDKWVIDRAPWALWFCAVGLFITLHLPSQGVNGPAQAILYLAMLALAAAAYGATLVMTQARVPLLLQLPIHVLLFVVAAFCIALGVKAVGGHLGSINAAMTPSQAWSMLVDPPPYVFGWMMIDMGLIWVAYSVYVHRHPSEPVFILSPAGVSFHRSWLRGLFIAWQDMARAGPLDVSTGSTPSLVPQVTVVTVSKDFYDGRVVPMRSVLQPPGSDSMFRAKGDLVQIVLTGPQIVVEPADLRVPVEVRWTAFHNAPRTSAVPDRLPEDGIVLGRWSYDGAWWRVAWFAAPAFAILGVAIQAFVAR